jgi:RND family efflux transporter MFP subunit
MNEEQSGRPDLGQLRINRDKPVTAMGKRPTAPMLIASALLVAGALGYFFWRSGSVAQVKAETVLVESGSGSAATVLDASGYVTARRQATVSAKRTGKVREVLVEEGMHVKEGQILAYLDDATERAQLDLANAQLGAARAALKETSAQLTEARLKFDRAQRLSAEKLASVADLDAARAQFDTLTARLGAQTQNVEVSARGVAVQRQALDETQVRAPFPGVVVAKTAQPGEMISPISAGGGFTRTGICTLVDMKSLEVEVDVNEAYIQRVTSGQRLTARLDAYPDWEIPAEVIAIIPTADRQKATVKVRVKILADDPRILPDMGVKVAFLEELRPAQSSAPARVSVPKAAVRDDAGKSYVYLVDDNVARKRIVSGEPAGDRLRIKSGLVGGERVIVEGPADLADGQRVKVL